MKTIIALFLLCSFIWGADGKWTNLPLTSAQGHLWSSTSELNKPADFNEIGRYCAVNIFDDNPATCWAEGVKGAGIGEKIYFDIPAGLTALKITTGLAKNKTVFKKNNRVKKLKITLYGAVASDEDMGQFFDDYKGLPYEKTLIFELKDEMTPQRLAVDYDWDDLADFKNRVLQDFKKNQAAQKKNSKLYFEYIAQLEILDVYRGSKWDDTCISDVDFIVGEGGAFRIDTIYTDENEHAVFFDTDKGKQLVLADEQESVFQIVEHSPDKKWVILIRMPAESEGRAETEYRLYYLPLKRKVDLKKMGFNVGDMYDFSQREGHTYLNCADNSTLDDIEIDLTKMVKEML
jgi:hypothetical protein